MGKVLVEESNLSSIASAIRSKVGGSTLYKPSEMAAAIGTIDTSGITPTGTVNISQNGTTDVTQYASANVNVPNSYSAGDEGKVVSNGTLVSQTARSSEITENGTYDTTVNNEVVVNVSGGGGSNIFYTHDRQLPDVGNDGDVCFITTDMSVELPQGYTIQPFLKGSGQEIINTGIPANTSNIKIKCSIKIYSDVTGSRSIFGGSWAANGLFLMTYGGKFRFHSGGVVVDSTNAVNADTWYHIEASNNYFSINEYQYNISNPGNNTSDTIKYAFSHSNGSSAVAYYGRMQIFSGDVLVADLIPCIDSNGVRCFYDIVQEVARYSTTSYNYLDSGLFSNIYQEAYIKANNAWNRIF